MDLYRSSDALLHTSWTEGLPQILFEAFAARLPVVASDVGGVPAAVGDAALLVAAGDVAGAAAAVRRVASDAELRERMTEAGAARVASRTLEASARGLARWLREVA
jgi:glycosyltransferase involved in cell wall biosynthesis